MRGFTAIVATLGIFGVCAASAPARAHDDDDNSGWRRQEWQEHQWREHEWRERAGRFYAPPPVAYGPPGYYVPQPTYYAPPPPAYYVAPPNAYYAPPPSPRYEASGISIGFTFR